VVKTKIILLWNYHEKDTYEKFDTTSRVLGYTKEVNILEHMLHSIMMSFMHFVFFLLLMIYFHVSYMAICFGLG